MSHPPAQRPQIDGQPPPADTLQMQGQPARVHLPHPGGLHRLADVSGMSCVNIDCFPKRYCRAAWAPCDNAYVDHPVYVCVCVCMKERQRGSRRSNDTFFIWPLSAKGFSPPPLLAFLLCSLSLSLLHGVCPCPCTSHAAEKRMKCKCTR